MTNPDKPFTAADAAKEHAARFVTENRCTREQAEEVIQKPREEKENQDGEE